MADTLCYRIAVHGATLEHSQNQHRPRALRKSNNRHSSSMYSKSTPPGRKTHVPFPYRLTRIAASGCFSRTIGLYRVFSFFKYPASVYAVLGSTAAAFSGAKITV